RDRGESERAEDDERDREGSQGPVSLGGSTGHIRFSFARSLAAPGFRAVSRHAVQVSLVMNRSTWRERLTPETHHSAKCSQLLERTRYRSSPRRERARAAASAATAFPEKPRPPAKSSSEISSTGPRRRRPLKPA